MLSRSASPSFGSVGGGQPAQLPVGATAYANFATGYYYFDGAVRTLSDMFEENPDWGTFDPDEIEPGVGLVTPSGHGSSPALTAEAVAGYAPSESGVTYVASFAFAEPTSNFTSDFFDAPDFAEEWYVTLTNGDTGTITSQPAADTEVVPGGNLDDGSHKIAVTMFATRFSASKDGAAVVSITVDLPDPSIADTLGFQLGPDTTLVSIALYPPKADAALPALSA